MAGRIAVCLNGDMNDSAELFALIDELRRELAALQAENAALRVPSKINASIFRAKTSYGRLFLTKIKAFILLGALKLKMRASPTS